MTTTSSLWTTDKTRSAFVDFFASKGHTFIKSSPVLPHDDPTLLFTNAGMNQFKARFLNQHDAKSQLATVTKVANSQKCIRAGGKHNDLDDVGKDTYHHTFFEMLGNWSFGDYYKKEAIDWAWELLTDVYKLDKDRIYVSYFAGNEAEGVSMDTEARDYWLKYLPVERVLPFGMKENFWEMGATGPCGPCSEIHYDRLGGRDAASLVNQDDPMVIEIWNLVFIQYNRGEDKALTLLNEKHVDTGMGLERITSILQGVHSNYDIDTFKELFVEIKKVANPQANDYQGRLGADDVDKVDMAYRVLADHIRTLTIAITDGVVPSNDGRGYVLRRVLRRAIRFGRQFFNAPIGFFHKLVPVVVKLFSGAFPELLKDPASVTEILKDEEITFARTLDNGIKKFDQMTKKLSPGDSIPPTETFKLYETFGFPFDLTQIMAEERGFAISKDDFTEVMKKTIAEQNKKSASVDIWKLDANALSHLRDNFKTTNDSFKYDPQELEATVVTLYEPNSKKFVDSIKVGEPCGVFFDQTIFYAEQGGQVADKGEGFSENITIDFTDAQTYGGYVIHIGSSGKNSGDIQDGDVIKKGDKFKLTINQQRRHPIVSNHTATHLVNFALRCELGNKVEQRGSYVIPERLRFDFSHGKGMSADELQHVDDIVNGTITKNLKIYDAEVPLEKAELIETLRKVPGEMYPNPVRVVSVGVPIEDLLAQPKNEEWLKYSVEFCGGTHLPSTEVVRKFCISGEEAIGKGIRRIVALTGEPAVVAHDNMKKYNAKIEEFEKLAETKPETLSEPVKAVEKELLEIELPAYARIRFRERISKLKNIKPKKESQEEKGKAVEKFISDVEEHLKTTGDKFYVGRFDAAAGVMTALVDIAKKINEKVPNASILLASPDAKKVTFHAKVPQEIVSSTSLKANAWASSAAVVCGGKGGGKPDTASGAGTNLEKIDEALAAAVAFAKSNL